MMGDPAHLAFEVSWPSSEPTEVRGLAWGELVLWFCGNRLWTSKKDTPVQWTWIDIVEHLARAWGHLSYEENAPFGLVADGPEHLRQRQLLQSVPGVSAKAVEDAIHGFQHRHDLAAGLKGLNLPSVWLLREGTRMRIRAANRDLWRPLDETFKLLATLAEEVLLHARRTAARTKTAAAQWEARVPSASKALAWRSTLAESELQSWAPAGAGVNWWGTADDETPMMAAARMSQPLGEATRRAIIAAIASTPSCSTSELDELTAAAGPVLEAVADRKPFQQGHALAQWLRTKLSLFGPLDPSTLIQRWGVHVAELSVNEEHLDAVACWGGRGPAIFLNARGIHASSAGGRRATVAHEIAHLILDRGRHLPLVEIFGGATPTHLEKRAKAFAAELLLPRDAASTALARHATLNAAATALMTEYGVSREVLGWQIQNGSGWDLLTAAERSEVKTWASTRRGRVPTTPARSLSRSNANRSKRPLAK
jgi:Zn-dependent peptidase ImmA (M78 family)